jgi:hypothetical protein
MILRDQTCRLEIPRIAGRAIVSLREARSAARVSLHSARWKEHCAARGGMIA